MHAAIFDIDGTLLDSFEDDAVLYVDAIRHVMGEVRIRDVFLGRLRAHTDTHGPYREIPGALAYLQGLSSYRDMRTGTAVALHSLHGN